MSNRIPHASTVRADHAESGMRHADVAERRQIGNCVIVTAIVLMSCVPAMAQDVTPGTNSIGLLSGSGEVQSAVVPPGIKNQCPAGRLFVSMDGARPPQAGTVIGRDLNGPAQIQSVFGPDPDVSHDAFLTNDHDLIVLPNGDLLLLWGVHIDAPLIPKPAWFDLTYHGDFGPGVRRGTAVYRSTDCGASFQFASKIDPATLDDGKCGLPQPWNPPSPTKLWNGGSDGQLARQTGGSLYLTMGCAGYLPDPSKPNFTLSSNPVNRTYVLESTDEGSTWTTLGFMTGDGWRTGIESLPNGNLAFAFGTNNFITLAHKLGGTYVFDPTALQPSLPWGWPDTKSAPFQLIGANVLAPTLLARVPGSGILALAYPASIKDADNQSVDGYELFFFDAATDQLSQAAPILPNSHLPGNYVLHLAAIDPGRGPILLYWIDVNGNEKSGRIMGRLIFGDGSYSDDFSVATTVNPSSANAGGKILTRPYVFQVGAAWYGDYHTAGGYTHVLTGPQPQTSHYYPMWIQSDGTARYSHLSYTTQPHHGRQKEPAMPHPAKHTHWKKAPPRVRVESILEKSKPGVVDESPSRKLPSEKTAR